MEIDARFSAEAWALLRLLAEANDAGPGSVIVTDTDSLVRGLGTDRETFALAMGELLTSRVRLGPRDPNPVYVFELFSWELGDRIEYRLCEPLLTHLGMRISVDGEASERLSAVAAALLSDWRIPRLTAPPASPQAHARLAARGAEILVLGLDPDGAEVLVCVVDQQQGSRSRPLWMPLAVQRLEDSPVFAPLLGALSFSGYLDPPVPLEDIPG